MTTAPRRPRIGVDFHTFDGIFQGSRSHLLGLYQAAIEQAPEIDFHLLLAEPERLLQEHPCFGAPNVKLARMPATNGVVRLAWQLPRLQKQLGLDLMHLQYRLPLWTSGPCAVTIHDVLFESHPQFFSKAFVQVARLSSRDAIRRSALLFTVSEFSRQQMAQAYGVNTHRIGVTHNGVDTQRFRPRQGEADGLQALKRHGLTSGGYLCIVGRLEPRKNHVNLVKAYAALPEPRPPLVIIGQRDFAFEAVFAEVKRLNLGEAVRFLERVGDEELPALIRHSAAFVYPTWAEGFGMPVLEAMACGVPVVTSNNTSLPEVAGDVAWMSMPDDVASITQAMHSALNEPEAAKAARVQRGIERAERFGWAQSARVLVKAYREQLRLTMGGPR
jgi:glycosyltransferase involved in cell wall biosynthesis